MTTSSLDAETSSLAPGNGGLTGIVVIGRNEGDRLVRCLKSIRDYSDRTVYVDSGSTDGSIAFAKSLGIEVVNLPMDRPFTAGRARNAGFARLTDLHPNLRYCQFLDGDCTLNATWIKVAIERMEADARLSIVCGRRMESHPERSRYNAFCDIEWNTPIGPATACGGDFLASIESFAEVAGFRETLIAGEEPEMCYRLRRLGWRIERLDHEMTYHDAEITRFSQWARRTTRSGYAYAARARLHWRDFSGYCWRENARIFVWAAGIPLASVVSIAAVSPWFALLLTGYPISLIRCFLRVRVRNPGMPNFSFSLFQLIGRWFEFAGQLRLIWRLLNRTEETIIEYK